MNTRKSCLLLEDFRFSKNDLTHEDIIKAAKGEEFVIKKNAPNIKIDGAQKFFSRTIKRT